jgi:hypothetical protein
MIIEGTEDRMKQSNSWEDNNQRTDKRMQQNSFWEGNNVSAVQKNTKTRNFIIVL